MVNFPQTLDDDNSLFLVVNNKRAALSSSMTDTDTTANVVTTAGFPDTGYISILTGNDILDTEAITYSGIDSTNFLNLVRGAGNTIAVPHLTGDDVDLTIVADHHNVLKDAVVEIETFLGTEDSKNFVPFTDGFNVILPETLTVSGTISVGSDGDFKDDVSVSGALSVGEIPLSSTPTATYLFEDTLFNTTSTSFVETGTSIVPEVGVNLVLFRMNASAGVEGANPCELKATFAAATVAQIEDGSNTLGHYNAGDLVGFKIIDTDGTTAVKLEVRGISGARSVDVGNQQIISIPLESMGLVENTDYWFDNGIDSDTTVTSGTTYVTITSLNADLPVTGKYLVFMYAEGFMTSAFNNEYTADLFVNDTQKSPFTSRHGTVSFHKHFAWTRLLNLNAGSNTFAVKGKLISGASNPDFRRCRICVINAASFDQMQEVTTFTDFPTNSTIFSEIGELTQTYTPNQQEQVLVIGYTSSDSDDVTAPNAVATYKIRDATDGIDYSTDFGGPQVETQNIVPSMGFAIKDNVSVPTEWKLFNREPNNSGGTSTFKDGSLTIWGLSTNLITSTQFTRITGSKILSPDICADTITVINSGTLTLDGGDLVAPTGTFSESLTISGEPVSTGTGGGASTLQEAYDGGDGTISTTGGKPFELTGTGELTAVTGTFSTGITATDSVTTSEIIAVTGTFTEGLTIGTGSTDIYEDSITTGSGIFTDTLTVSGIPVRIDTAGAGAGVDDVNSVTGSVVIDGSGGIVVNTASQTITIDGSGVAGGGGEGTLTTSGLYFNVHAIPEDVHPRSDFFDDNSENPTLSGNHHINWDKWSLWDVDTVSGTSNGTTAVGFQGSGGFGNSFDLNMMRVQHDDSTGGGWVGFYQDVPSSGVDSSTGDFTITTKVGIQGTFQSNTDIRMGIFIADDLDGSPSTSDLYSCHLHHISGQFTHDFGQDGLYSQVQGALWTDYNSISTEFATVPGSYPGNSAWLRLNYQVSNGRVESAISEDGINWKKLEDEDLAFIPSHMGFGIQLGSSASATAASFEFFAVGDVSFRGNADGYGRLVPVVISGGGGGGGGITDINTSATGPSVTITGVSDIHTITEGNTITISGGFRGAKVSLTESISVGSDATVELPWHVEAEHLDYDTDGFLLSSGTTFLQVPEGVAKIRCTGQTLWSNNTETTWRAAALRAAGGTAFHGAAFGNAVAQGNTTINLTTPVVTVTGGQRFALQAQNHDGTGINGSLTAKTVPHNPQNWFAIEVIE